MIEQIAPTTNRPYPPPSNVMTVLKRLRSRNLSERVDSEYLRDAGVPDGTNARTLFALRFLGLLDGDSPSPALRSIATSTDEEYQTTLAGLIRDAYREVFETIDPAQDTQDRIFNFFRRYTPASQRERMVVFFLSMCREAGIATLEAPRQRSGSASPKPKAANAATTRTAGRLGSSRNAAQTPRSGDRGEEQRNIPPALDLLVRSLPPAGSAFPASRRKQWLSMASATLAFVYPDDEEGSDQQEEEVEE
jgi:hypothetical protein